jgi:excinuclease ABC subunit C
VRILRGDVGPVLGELRTRMQQAAAEALEFERAQALKEQIAALQLVAEPQNVVASTGDEDALGVHRTGDEVAVAFLSFRGGALENCRRHAFRSTLPDDLLLGELLGRFYEGDRYVPPTIVLPYLPAEPAMITRGSRTSAAARSSCTCRSAATSAATSNSREENARLADAMAADAEARRRAGAERLARLLDLPEPPHRLHCLDVSTIQGTSTVASRVCFVDGAPHKSQYRRFKISAEHAGDDFGAMQEAVRRSCSSASNATTRTCPTCW